MAGTCRTCLVCLRAPTLDANLPHCGVQCSAVAEALAPTMIEVPRGHVLFDKCGVPSRPRSPNYVDEFKSAGNVPFRESWGTSLDGDYKVSIKHMFFFVHAQGIRERYDNYRCAYPASNLSIRQQMD